MWSCHPRRPPAMESIRSARQSPHWQANRVDVRLSSVATASDRTGLRITCGRCLDSEWNGHRTIPDCGRSKATQPVVEGPRRVGNRLRQPGQEHIRTLMLWKRVIKLGAMDKQTLQAGVAHRTLPGVPSALEG